MKQLSTLALFMLIIQVVATAQKPIKLDYFSKVPVAIKDCGALYTYDSVSLSKKKFILLTDFQSLGIITVAGKQIKLQLKEATTVDKVNITSFEGGGYMVVLKVKTDRQTPAIDLESGTMEVTKGSSRLQLKIHGQSACDPSKQEGNSR